MILYDVKLYDVKTDTATIVITLPERRRDPDRPGGSGTVERWAKSLLGEDWWLQNWHNISITERDNFGYRNGNGGGSKRKVLRPPKRGGVD